ncbi:hypothetical protein Q9R46_00135 [Paenibacillus sp. RRE4]|uniref:hypothetical protein n=1 Tax=Paenibacillus sp. RRE4 TaxID=2962587 RepID=UPI002880E8B0|nr:hypothetical protein [Paenibacillus sp. RRE4]MDT0121031.1 hypothetical protein [Paenibacillus sp. RRE4]
MKLFKAFKEWSDQNDGQIEIFTSAGKMTAINRLKPGATNLETWLERFILSQGEKFWYWKTDRYTF